MTAPYRSNTHGPTATSLVEADFEGGMFKISGTGAIITGTQSAGAFTAAGTCGSPIYRPDRLQREVDILASLWGLSNMQRESFGVPFYCVTTTGSTTTVIQIAEPTLPTIAATANHILYILDSASGPARPPYLVASTTGTTITLTGAMSEAAPAAGVRVILVAKRKLLPNASDFPNPSIGFTDGTTQGVIEVSTRKIWRATAGTDLTKIASGSGTIELDIGAVAGNGNVTVTNKPQGDWDFSDAAVSGVIPVGSNPGDLLVWDGAAWSVLPIGADGTFLTADSGADLGLSWT